MKAESQRGRGSEGPAREGSSMNVASELRAEIPEGINPERKELVFSLRAGEGLDGLGDEQRPSPE